MERTQERPAFINRRFAVAIAAAIGAMGGAAAAEERTYPLAGFSKISAATGITVFVAAGGDFNVQADADAKEFERLVIELDGDTLSIRRKSGGFGWRNGEVRVNVSMPALEGIEASSGASVDAKNISAPEFEIEASSGASVRASGSCGVLDADVSSGASIKATDLTCEDANADASSGGSLSVFASRSMEADASSGGSINVAGNPGKMSKSTSSGGSVSIGG